VKPELKEIKKNSPSKFSEPLKKAANGEWDDFNALLEEAYTTHETETSGGRMYLNEENWEKHCVARGKDDKYAAREWKKTFAWQGRPPDENKKRTLLYHCGKRAHRRLAENTGDHAQDQKNFERQTPCPQPPEESEKQTAGRHGRVEQ